MANIEENKAWNSLRNNFVNTQSSIPDTPQSGGGEHQLEWDSSGMYVYNNGAWCKSPVYTANWEDLTPTTRFLRVDAEQSLSEAEKTQAKSNLGITEDSGGGDITIDSSVLWYHAGDGNLQPNPAANIYAVCTGTTDEGGTLRTSNITSLDAYGHANIHIVENVVDIDVQNGGVIRMNAEHGTIEAITGSGTAVLTPSSFDISFTDSIAPITMYTQTGDIKLETNKGDIYIGGYSDDENLHTNKVILASDGGNAAPFVVNSSVYPSQPYRFDMFSYGLTLESDGSLSYGGIRVLSEEITEVAHTGLYPSRTGTIVIDASVVSESNISILTTAFHELAAILRKSADVNNPYASSDYVHVYKVILYGFAWQVETTFGFYAANTIYDDIFIGNFSVRGRLNVNQGGAAEATVILDRVYGATTILIAGGSV